MRFHRIRSREALIEAAFHRLGSPVIHIEIATEQIQDCLDDAFDFFMRYHSDGSLNSYLIHRITNDDMQCKFFDLSPETTVDDRGDNINIISVVRVFPMNEARLTANSMWDLRYQLFLNSNFDFINTNMSNYVITMNHVRLIEQTLIGEVPIRYNRYMKRLYTDWNWSEVHEGDTLVAEIYQEIDPFKYPDIWDDRWLREYFYALMKRQWGANLKKYTGTQLLGGVHVDGQKIYDEAVAEIERLEGKLMTDHSAPMQFFIN